MPVQCVIDLAIRSHHRQFERMVELPFLRTEPWRSGGQFKADLAIHPVETLFEPAAHPVYFFVICAGDKPVRPDVTAQNAPAVKVSVCCLIEQLRQVSSMSLSSRSEAN